MIKFHRFPLYCGLHHKQSDCHKGALKIPIMTGIPPTHDVHFLCKPSPSALRRGSEFAWKLEKNFLTFRRASQSPNLINSSFSWPPDREEGSQSVFRAKKWWCYSTSGERQKRSQKRIDQLGYRKSLDHKHCEIQFISAGEQLFTYLWSSIFLLLLHYFLLLNCSIIAVSTRFLTSPVEAVLRVNASRHLRPGDSTIFGLDSLSDFCLLPIKCCKCCPKAVLSKRMIIIPNFAITSQWMTTLNAGSIQDWLPFESSRDCDDYAEHNQTQIINA